MLYPSIDQLLQQVKTQFTLVTLVSKRAHQLNNKAPRLVLSAPNAKSVSVALEEIATGKIKPKYLPDKKAA